MPSETEIEQIADVCRHYLGATTYRTSRGLESYVRIAVDHAARQPDADPIALADVLRVDDALTEIGQGGQLLTIDQFEALSAHLPVFLETLPDLFPPSHEVLSDAVPALRTLLPWLSRSDPSELRNQLGTLALSRGEAPRSTQLQQDIARALSQLRRASASL